MTKTERFVAIAGEYTRRGIRKGLSVATVDNYRATCRSFEQFLLWKYPDGGEGYVDFADISSYIEKMSENHKASSVKQNLVVLKQIFTFAAKDFIPEELRYDTCPVSADFFPKVPVQPVLEVLPDEVVPFLWNFERRYKTTEAKFARNYALTVLAICTGLRNQEILSLSLADVDFRYHEITTTHAKGNKFRVVDLPEIAETALELYLALGDRPKTIPDTAPLFGTTAAHSFGGNVSNAGETWHKGTKEWLSSTIENHVYYQTGEKYHGVRSHDLRHLFARLTLNATGNLAELQGAMGHSSPITTERYSGRIMHRRRRESAEKIFAERDEAAKKNREILEAVKEEKKISMLA